MSGSRFRSVFLSDIHLGTRGCQAERLLDFLREPRVGIPVPDRRHRRLLGDEPRHPLDAGRRTPWCRRSCAAPATASKVIFIPGNHDEALREYVGTSFGDIRVAKRSTCIPRPTAGATC